MNSFRHRGIALCVLAPALCFGLARAQRLWVDRLRSAVTQPVCATARPIFLLPLLALAADQQTTEKQPQSGGDAPAANRLESWPQWLRHLHEALAHPVMGFLLLLVGFSALYCELQMPGIGAAGFAATICLVLFFWNRFLGGTVEWLDVLLLLTGIACLVLEFLVIPGFGIFGAGGVLLVVLSLVLANQSFVVPTSGEQFRQLVYSVCIVVGALLGTMLVVATIGQWLTEWPVLNKVFLRPLRREEVETIRRREALADWSHLSGAKGLTVTPLKPGGKVQFGEQLVDVVAQGELIPAGIEVVVVEAKASRVVVVRADGTKQTNRQEPAR